MKTENIQIVPLGIEISGRLLSGLGFCYDSREAADAVWLFIEKYFEAPNTSDKEITLDVRTAGERAVVTWRIEIDEQSLTAIVHEVPLNYVTAVRDTLKHFKYYFIVTMFCNSDGNIEAYKPEELHLYRSTLAWNGNLVTWGPLAEWPVPDPLREQ